MKVPLYWGNYIGADIYSETLEQIYIQKFFINTKKKYKTEKLPYTELFTQHGNPNEANNKEDN